MVKIKMAAILPHSEVRTQKLMHNLKLYMLLGVCGEKSKNPFKTPKIGGDKSAPRV